MPYSGISKLNRSLRDKLPKHAQEIYVEAYNSAFDRYEDADKRQGNESREEAAHRVAWSAVKQEYEKGDDEKWHRRRDQ